MKNLAPDVQPFEAKNWKKKGYRDLQLLLLKYLPGNRTINQLEALADEIYSQIDKEFETYGPPGGVVGRPTKGEVTFTLKGVAERSDGILAQGSREPLPQPINRTAGEKIGADRVVYEGKTPEHLR